MTDTPFQHNQREAEERLHPGFFHSRRYVLRSLRKHLEVVVGSYLDRGGDATVVDFGGGSMPYRSIFRNRVKRYVGVDLPGNPLAEVVVLHDGRSSLESGFADVVLSTQVLEHVAEPTAYLLECRRVLKPGALLILSTHGHWMYHPDPVDYWRWTKSGLVKVVEEAGFQLLEVRGVVGLCATGVQFVQDGLTTRMPRLARLGFVAIMQRIAWVADRLETASSRDANACVYLIVARSQGGPS